MDAFELETRLRELVRGIRNVREHMTPETLATIPEVHRLALNIALVKAMALLGEK